MKIEGVSLTQRKKISHLLGRLNLFIFNMLLLYACGKRKTINLLTHIIMMILTTMPLKVTLHLHHPPDLPLQKLLPNQDKTNPTLTTNLRVFSSYPLFLSHIFKIYLFFFPLFLGTINFSKTMLNRTGFSKKLFCVCFHLLYIVLFRW